MKFILTLALVSVLLAASSAGPTPKIFFNNDPMQNSDLFEGDIQLDPEEAALVKEDPQKGLNQITTGRGAWPNGIVPYVVDTNAKFTTDEISTISRAMRLIEDRTRLNGKDCIKFVPRSNEATYLRLTSQSGCWSYVGRQGTAGSQDVSLQRPASPGAGHCLWTGTVAHELIHALGFLHEQSRADRDNFITINYANIISGYEYNFDKVTSNYNYHGQVYDLDSIMHYENTAFSKNGQPTVVAKNGQTLLNAAYKPDITNIDVAELRAFYKCT